MKYLAPAFYKRNLLGLENLHNILNFVTIICNLEIVYFIYTYYICRH